MPTITHFFTHDHMRMDRLYERFQQSKSRDRAWAIALFLEFKNELEQHMHWEEDIIFPLYHRKLAVPNSAIANRMCAEHIALRKLLEQILEALEKGEECEVLEQEFSQLIQEHNEKEDGELYPHFDSLATHEDYEELFFKIQQARRRAVVEEDR